LTREEHSPPAMKGPDIGVLLAQEGTLFRQFGLSEQPILLVDGVEVRSQSVAVALRDRESLRAVLALEDIDEQTVWVWTYGVLFKRFYALGFNLRVVCVVTLGKESLDVIPRALVVGRLGNPRESSVDFVLQRGELWGMCEDEVAHIPGGVVPQVLHQQVVKIRQLLLPKIEVFDDPLPIRPGVVVFGVGLDQNSSEFELAGGIVRLRHKPLSMMPYLIVLRILGSQLIRVFKIRLQQLGIIQ